MDFICGNEKCMRVVCGYGNYMTNLKKENEALKPRIAELEKPPAQSGLKFAPLRGVRRSRGADNVGDVFLDPEKRQILMSDGLARLDAADCLQCGYMIAAKNSRNPALARIPAI